MGDLGEQISLLRKLYLIFIKGFMTQGHFPYTRSPQSQEKVRERTTYKNSEDPVSGVKWKKEIHAKVGTQIRVSGLPYFARGIKKVKSYYSYGECLNYSARCCITEGQ